MKFASLLIDMNFIGQAEHAEKIILCRFLGLFSAQAELPFFGFVPARLA